MYAHTAPVSLQNCLPAVSNTPNRWASITVKTPGAFSLGGEAIHLAPAQLSSRPQPVPGEPGWGPWAVRVPPPCGQNAGRAGSYPLTLGSGPIGGPQPSGPGRALARVSWLSGGPRRSFQELTAYLLAAALSSGETVPVASPN